ncbi:MAG TPA: alkaline phosphatase family protein [Streptosporangiaceae bacterium]|nr:alkaline phosphatase family protein [Streptosporangiaceae bacterium]
MTIEVTRRQLMRSAGGMVLASYALPPNLRKLIENAPASLLSTSRPAASLSGIKHVVILMQENRSFDHYFGAMPGVRGFSDPNAITLPNGKPVFYQPDSQNPDGYLLPFHADTRTTNAQQLPSNSHSWGSQHDSWDNGVMDGFVTTHIAYDTQPLGNFPAGEYSMAYFKRQDIPFHWALADAFTICDGYHCSVLGPTWPNRLYLMTGQINPEGGLGGPIFENEVPPQAYSWPTYPELLTAAGVPWKVYQEIDNYGFNVLEYFDNYQTAPVNSALYQGAMKFYQPGQFEYDAIHDQLPTVSWLLPTAYQSEHPDYMPAFGADYVRSKIDAIAANPDVWAKTLFILIYDENDGFFDHVVPPTPPADTANEFLTESYYNLDDVKVKTTLPIGLGFRVPCILVSPWTVGGYVSHDTFDHTSVIRLLEQLTGVFNPNISAWRRATVGDFTSALGQYPSWRIPRLPDTVRELERAEQESVEFALPPIPGSNQTVPVQEPGTRRVRSAAASAAAKGV